MHEAARLQEDLRRAGITPFAWIVNQTFAAFLRAVSMGWAQTGIVAGDESGFGAVGVGDECQVIPRFDHTPRNR